MNQRKSDAAAMGCARMLCARANALPQTNEQWAKILMVQTLKCDSLTAGDKFPCGEWDYIWSTFVDVPKGDSTERYCLGSFVTPYGKRLELGGEDGWEWIYDISEYAPILKGDLNLIVGNNQELLDLKFLFIRKISFKRVPSPGPISIRLNLH